MCLPSGGSRRTHWTARPENLHEIVFNFFEDAFFMRFVVNRQGFSELFDEFSLFPGEFSWNFYNNMDYQIAVAPPLNLCHALAPEPEFRAALNTFGNLQC